MFYVYTQILGYATQLAHCLVSKYITNLLCIQNGRVVALTFYYLCKITRCPTNQSTPVNQRSLIGRIR